MIYVRCRATDDEDHHHGLASGQTTPHPSMMDRRLPGIPHTFQQVCIGSLQSNLRPRLPPLPTFLTKLKNHSIIHKSSIFYSRFLPEKASELTLSVHEREKETPPPTPRGTASTGSTHCESVASTAPTSVPSRSVSGTSSPTNSTPAPNLAPPIGKLLVRVDEARGIRNSQDPYFVCTFESNEFISKGPKIDNQDDMNSNGQPMGAPSRGGSGISIPMKSRQSPGAHSKTENGVTHLSWGYEAML